MRSQRAGFTMLSRSAGYPRTGSRKDLSVRGLLLDRALSAVRQEGMKLVQCSAPDRKLHTLSPMLLRERDSHSRSGAPFHPLARPRAGNLAYGWPLSAH
jgi:hypothetical protein